MADGCFIFTFIWWMEIHTLLALIQPGILWDLSIMCKNGSNNFLPYIEKIFDPIETLYFAILVTAKKKNKKA